MDVQQTIAKPATLEGRGLFGGHPATLTFRPAPTNHGVVFVRTDMGKAEIPALVQYVVKRARRTALKCGEASIDTCEHCLSAVAALQIDNLIIEVTGPEVPALDGSAKPFFDALTDAGIEASSEPRQRLIVTEPVMVRHEDTMVAAMPSEEPGLHLVYELDYGNNGPIGRQLRVFDCHNGNYAHDIAPSRTFVLEQEANVLRERGLGKHLSPDDVLVIGDKGPLGTNKFRFDDEPVRHKMLDLIGDLYLLGAPIQGRIVAYKSGHALNHMLVRKLIKQHQSQVRRRLSLHRNVLDIRRIARILPHRYPMLLVDRIVEIDGDRRAIGIKNVTMNEPFFQGHYPGTPIMPGVLVVEAMAQLSGVLIGQKLEHTGKLAVLLSLDRVKLRRPVTPGDQIVMEAEAVRVRSRIAHMRCRAYVAEELAAEAEVKFMLVDDDQE
ncbi:UDP-3-O-acyl-N-acetylglucosamine deacetylase [Phycisphaerales bacterium AB-hyl4]|uniref:Multifunctional fusion protein n=1 Tax=Natronomicrosphaera hydrolytica TaxID=3242702 RepID=A0ABV4TZF8_9BACT